MQEFPLDFTAVSQGKPCADLAKLEKNDVFFCENGTSYIQTAVDRGASAIVTNTDLTLSVPVYRADNVKKAFAMAWSDYTGHPEKKLRIIAVTGTNGKTSVVSFLTSLLKASGEKVGSVGTVSYDDGEASEDAPYTTPPPDILYPLFQRMVQNGVRYVVMEASSHGISQSRLYGLSFDIAIFTNLTRDHLDYHKTFDDYRKVKASLFCQAEKAVICMDDKAAYDMAWEAKKEVYYYGRHPLADFRITNLYTGSGIAYTLHTDYGNIPVVFPHPGDFQAENTAAAVSAYLLLKGNDKALQKGIYHLRPPKGRMEKVKLPTPCPVYIDYAHTPDAMKAALSSLRPLTNRLTVLFGAGGNRDKGKRQQMGEVADAYADRIILTNDNVRNENPSEIMAQIASGIHSKIPICIPDREKAICYALSDAKENEIILLAGKGHEAYTVDENGKHPFSETETIQKYLERKGKENVSELT